VPAKDLVVGMHVVRLDGTAGVVQSMLLVTQPERMYNLGVADAHTFFVGDDQWLVHNCLGSYGWLRGQGLKDAHHIIQHAAVRNLPGYTRSGAPAIVLRGPSTRVGTPHYLATQAQNRAIGGGTYAAERRIAYRALRHAGVSRADARGAIHYADGYFRSIGVGPNTATRIPRRY